MSSRRYVFRKGKLRLRRDRKREALGAGLAAFTAILPSAAAAANLAQDNPISQESADPEPIVLQQATEYADISTEPDASFLLRAWPKGHVDIQVDIQDMFSNLHSQVWHAAESGDVDTVDRVAGVAKRIELDLSTNRIDDVEFVVSSLGDATDFQQSVLDLHSWYFADPPTSDIVGAASSAVAYPTDASFAILAAEVENALGESLLAAELRARPVAVSEEVPGSDGRLEWIRFVVDKARDVAIGVPLTEGVKGLIAIAMRRRKRGRQSISRILASVKDHVAETFGSDVANVEEETLLGDQTRSWLLVLSDDRRVRCRASADGTVVEALSVA